MMVRNLSTWDEIRARRAPDEAAVARHRDRLEAEQRAYKLSEIRNQHGVTQAALAQRLQIAQPAVSQIESCDLERSAVSTLRSYIEALGGSLNITATFGSETLTLASTKVPT